MKKLIVCVLIFCLSGLFYFVNEKSLLDVVTNLNINICNANNDNLITVNSNLDLLISSMNIEKVSSREVSGRLVIEGYTNSLNNYIVVNNSKINIQLSVLDDEIIIGYPLISSSF